jgi:hypothetical protein
VDGALASLRPRFRRARTRRRVARGSLAVVASIAMGSVAYALAGSSSHPDTVSVVAPSTNRPSGSGPTTTAGGSTTTLAPRRTEATTVTTAPARPPTPAPTAPERGGGAPPAAPGPSPGASATTTTVPPAELHTYTSDGGTITVRFSGGTLTLVSYRAAAGYAAEVHRDDPDDVEVRFSGEHDRRIRVRVENGRLAPEID